MANPTNQPMYRKIKEDILHQINSNLLLPGDRLPTERELMQQYKVSRITVSKALGELKKEGRIERFPNKGTFVSRMQLSPSSASGRNWLGEDVRDACRPAEIACIIPTVADMFSLSMMNGILSVFPENEYVCHCFQSRNPQMENYLLKLCLETNISGIVLFPQDQPFFSNELLWMNLQNYPLVLLDRYLPHLNTSYVIADNKMAGELCVRHLHGLGHQCIAFITSSDRNTFSVKYRLEGTRAAAVKCNLPENAIHLVEHMDTGKAFGYYEEMMIKLIHEEKVTALIASECHTCIYLYNLCASLKIGIPEDISLLSFDKPMAGNRNPDFFTHIDQSEFLMGREAGAILRRRIEQNDIDIYRKVITPSLEIRQSSAAVVF